MPFMISIDLLLDCSIGYLWFVEQGDYILFMHASNIEVDALGLATIPPRELFLT